MREVVYTPAALADLRSITIYIAADNPDRAASFVEDLRAEVSAAAERPASCPSREDLAPKLRAARHGRYLIFFIYDDGKLEVVRVLHGARDLGRAFED